MLKIMPEVCGRSLTPRRQGNPAPHVHAAVNNATGMGQIEDFIK